MTIDEYKAIRDAHVGQWMKILRVLDAAGLDGRAELDALERLDRERTKAVGSLSWDDFMTVDAEWRAEADAILANGRRLRAESSTPLVPPEGR